MSETRYAAAVYRGKLAYPFAVGCLVVAAAALWDAGAHGDGRARRVVVAAVLLALALVYALALRPAVLVDDRGVRLRNVVRGVDIPWAQVAGVTTYWGLVVDTEDGRRFAAWAISAGRRQNTPAAADSAARAGLSADVDLRPPSHARVVVEAVRERWQGWQRDQPSTAEPESEPVRVRPAWLPVALVLAASAALVWALA